MSVRGMSKRIYTRNTWNWDAPVQDYCHNYFHCGVAMDRQKKFAAVGCITDMRDRAPKRLRDGVVKIYNKEGDVWAHKCDVIGKTCHNGDNYAQSMSLYNNVLAVGTQEDEREGECAGCVYIFEECDGEWFNTHKVIASDAAEGYMFGSSVSLYKDKMVVGSWEHEPGSESEGAVYYFEKDGSTWIEKQIIKSPDSYNCGQSYSFGHSTAFYKDRLVVGACKYRWDYSRKPGQDYHSYMYKLVNNRWEHDLTIKHDKIRNGSVSYSGLDWVTYISENDEHVEFVGRNPVIRNCTTTIFNE